MRVRGQHCLRVIPEACGYDVRRNASGERQRGTGVAQRAKRPDRDADSLAVNRERVSEAIGPDRCAELLEIFNKAVA
jgi:hypothetical protein